MQKYDIHGKGVPELHHAEELEEQLKKIATKEMYESFHWRTRSGTPNSDAPHAVNASNAKISKDIMINLLPLLEKCFPSIVFRITGDYLYGPGDAIDEHTNSNDPSDLLYITYATGESSFSYRFSLDDDFIETPDYKNGLTLRAFTLTSSPPFTYHKVDCKSGYRVSIGLRYAQL